MRKTYIYIDKKNQVRDEKDRLIKPDKKGRYWIHVPEAKELSEEELTFYWWRLVIFLFYPVFWLRDVVFSLFGKANYFERRIETLASFKAYLEKHESDLKS